MAKRRTHMAGKRAEKRARRERMRAGELTTGHKSKYAQKVARKRGRGAVDPRWMWWMEPRKEATAPSRAVIVEAAP